MVAELFLNDWVPVIGKRTCGLPYYKIKHSTKCTTSLNGVIHVCRCIHAHVYEHVWLLPVGQWSAGHPVVMARIVAMIA